MKNISIITDGSCDIPKEIVEKYGVKLIPLHFQFEDQVEYGSERKMEIGEFYKRLANGEVAKTSASSPSAALQILKEELEKGNDIICVTLSSALSCTFNNIRLASLELLDSYPENRITIIDSLTGSMAMGMLVIKACMMRDEKYSYDQIVEYLEENKQSFHVEFYVNDLQYLARGGRLNPAIAKIGGLIGIKPILSVSPVTSTIRLFSSSQTSLFIAPKHTRLVPVSFLCSSHFSLLLIQTQSSFQIWKNPPSYLTALSALNTKRLPRVPPSGI